MSNIRQIPGFYYDQEKNKYFKVVNGTTTVESTKRYHNNSIQIQKRKDTLQTISKQSSNSAKLITNPLLTLEEKTKISQLTSKPVTPFDLGGLTYIKSGVINLSSYYYKHDQIDGIGKPKYIPELVPRGIVLGQLNQDLLVVHRITEPIIRNRVLIQSPKYLTIQNITTGKVYNIPQIWKFRDGSTMVDYLTRNKLEISKEIVIHDIIPGISSCNFLQIITLENMQGSLLKFNRCQGLEFYDYTEELLLFIQSQTKKVSPSMKKLMSELFGLDLIQFNSNKNTISIEETNNKLTQLKLNISLQTKLKLESEIKQFVNSKMITDNKLRYKETKPPGNQRFLLSGYFANNLLYLLGIEGHIFKIRFTIQSSQIKFHDLYYTKINNKLHQGHLQIFENLIYVTMGETLYKLDLNLPLLGTTNSYLQYTSKHLPGLRKLFPIRSELLLVISRDEIYYLSDSNKQIIQKYNHENDTNQNFEILKNHLIYNTENKFNIINLNRSDGNRGEFIIDFNYLKCGYLKDFKLVKIIEMINFDTRLRIGLTFYNFQEKTTIFESYKI